MIESSVGDVGYVGDEMRSKGEGRNEQDRKFVSKMPIAGASQNFRRKHSSAVDGPFIRLVERYSLSSSSSTG